MTANLFRAGLAGLACVFAMAAQAGQPGWYAGLHGGINDLDDGWDATVSLGGPVRVPGKLSLDRGQHWGLFAGKQTENARFELEYQRGDFDITRIQLGPQQQAMSTGGDYDLLTINAYRTWDPSDSYTLYAGLGIGWGHTRLPLMGFTSGCQCFAAASRSDFVYQGRLGAEYHFAHGHNAFVQATWIALPTPGSRSNPGVVYSGKGVRALSVGYRKEF